MWERKFQQIIVNKLTELKEASDFAKHKNADLATLPLLFELLYTEGQIKQKQQSLKQKSVEYHGKHYILKELFTTKLADFFKSNLKAKPSINISFGDQKDYFCTVFKIHYYDKWGTKRLYVLNTIDLVKKKDFDSVINFDDLKNTLLDGLKDQKIKTIDLGLFEKNIIANPNNPEYIVDLAFGLYSNATNNDFEKGLIDHNGEFHLCNLMKIDPKSIEKYMIILYKKLIDLKFKFKKDKKTFNIFVDFFKLVNNKIYLVELMEGNK